ncbi:hypothetical protein CS542_07055 [Pedobacter sp. IW39]|nr:hypothetical protein CS542_07055 [Pedobacter sp. IW39]
MDVKARITPEFLIFPGIQLMVIMMDKTATIIIRILVSDAMDGTIQYLQHIPGWTINLVLIRNGNCIFGDLRDPLSNEMFWAQQGHAFMNINQPSARLILI